MLFSKLFAIVIQPLLHLVGQMYYAQKEVRHRQHLCLASRVSALWCRGKSPRNREASRQVNLQPMRLYSPKLGVWQLTTSRGQRPFMPGAPTISARTGSAHMAERDQ